MTRDAWKNRDEAIDARRSEASRGSARAARSKTEATMGRRTVTATPTIGSFISVREEAGTGSGRLFSDRAVLTHRAAAAAATGYPLIAVSLSHRAFSSFQLRALSVRVLLLLLLLLLLFHRIVLPPTATFALSASIRHTLRRLFTSQRGLQQRG